MSAVPMPLGAAASVPAPSTPTNTPWIWLAVLLPLLGVIPTFLFDWQGYVHAIVTAGSSHSGVPLDALERLQQFMVIGAFSWLLGPASIAFYWADWRELGRRGITQRFHWAWSILGLWVGGALLPVIGRHVVLRRQGLRAGPVLAVTITLYALMLVGMMVWGAILFTTMITEIRQSAG